MVIVLYRPYPNTLASRGFSFGSSCALKPPFQLSADIQGVTRAVLVWIQVLHLEILSRRRLSVSHSKDEDNIT